MTKFETAFPSDAIQVFITWYRTRTTPTADLALAELTIQSYVMGQIFIGGTFGTRKATKQLTADEVVDKLEEMVAVHRGSKKAGKLAAAAFNWMDLLPLLVQLIQILSKG